MVAKIDKQHTAMVADPVYPTGKADILARLVNTELATGVATEGVHESSLK